MRYLIVDGHSVVFAWPELRALHQRRTASAREELVRQLTQYQDATGIRVVAVFDGRGLKLGDLTEPGGIQVFYSESGQTADTVIERLCARHAQEHDLTVASDDLMERQTALSFGASTLSSGMLRGLLAGAGAELQRRLRGHRRG